MRLRQRPRLRTTTKLVFVFGISSFLSIAVGIIYYFNLSNVKDLYGTSGTGVVVDGRMEVMDKELPSGFEVKEFDTKSPTMAHDSVVLYKKMKP